ncbi:bifunctional phosphopantothenoylcysteine decarboxylase/phosphopantothenate--cysteine ligase CoaBC [Shewanella surugensis]|uniref:Coenzyme A biosynthesis bifunctional protein CoaBC n=1 Tax=Shewanella surugensis TaxID=212020 RepID=A0ABT0L7D6_9GAMM|nr:bifunctional phosphopantothenoylcysteine decarboxylase/phosphopantothenate--cysteine ligase CoaBC [Shewanella surugensis]MCL1123575.1 bifunctional phosphopantothenoylcysteine decarboxylase/phosphopantothenate--cysteine ligase CoaBC [Shewanella surugensis]
MSLTNKNILLGIGGGIAAYKSAELVRRLKERGANVRVIMSQSAQAFITPLTLQALSGNPLAIDLLDPAAEAAMGHIELARWADLVIIAPATANLLARLNAGMADELITTTCLATHAPVIVCPAMNQQMYLNLTTQENLSHLQRKGVPIWGPDSGSQACGEIGPGRMLEANDIANRASDFFAPQPFENVNLLLTAGPTREAIDPVRYISNHSSGKMGFALAQAASEMGAKVTLVSGPVNLSTPLGVTRIDVDSAAEMHAAVMQHVNHQDIFIGCAAVADYRIANIATRKLKKSSSDTMTLDLVKNPDILASVANLTPKPFTVGFAAETQDVVHYAKDKLMRKKLDMIAANDVSQPELGFNADNNALCVIWDDGQQMLPTTDKYTLAKQLLSLIADKRLNE